MGGLINSVRARLKSRLCYQVVGFPAHRSFFPLPFQSPSLSFCRNSLIGEPAALWLLPSLGAGAPWDQLVKYRGHALFELGGEGFGYCSRLHVNDGGTEPVLEFVHVQALPVSKG